jgi:anti-sigma B factor antagonist
MSRAALKTIGNRRSANFEARPQGPSRPACQQIGGPALTQEDDPVGADAALKFAVETLMAEGQLVLAVTGETDLYTAPRVLDELLRLVATGVSRLVIDLSEATFIDSTFIATLVRARKELVVAGGDEIALVAKDKNVKVFEITGLDRAFRIFETREAAVRALVSSRESAN